jgi:hypothetical protein
LADRQVEPALNRLLLLVGEATPETVRLALEGRPARVHVLATTVAGPLAWLANAEEDARLRADLRALEAERALDGLVEVTSASGEIDPVDATGKALAEFPADDIFVGGSAADEGLYRALSVYGLPVTFVGPPAGRKARINREVRELAGGRNAGRLFAFLVGINVALMVAAIVLSLFALFILWLVGAF